MKALNILPTEYTSFKVTIIKDSLCSCKLNAICDYLIIAVGLGLKVFE